MSLKNILKPKKNSVKGDNGVCLIIGGSEIYTGAPYFASLSAFRSGCDLVYIFTSNKNLKILCPEAIVCDIDTHDWILNRITVCIIGCGLGRINETILSKIIEIVKRINVPIIIDGDGLHYFNHFKILKKKFILTPNHNEIKKLEFDDEYVVLKGESDLIKFKDLKIRINECGSLKRCGGQGDILVGIIAGLMGTGLEMMDVLKYSCIIMRKAAYKAYNKFGRSLIAEDIIPYINDSIQELTENY